MFNDTIVLNIADVNGPFDKSVSLTDLVSGRSLRRFNASQTARYEFSIAKSNTTENKPVLTSRIVVRADHIVYDNTLLREVKASAYIVISVPSGTTGPTDPAALVMALIGFISDPAAADWDTGESVTVTTAQIASTTNRLITGEL